MGGKLSLHSVLGEGSSFSVMLAFEMATFSPSFRPGVIIDISRKARGKREAAAARLMKQRYSSLSLRGMVDTTIPARILIVDDVPVNCKILARTFNRAAKRLGLATPTIVTAKNGQIAVNVVAATLAIATPDTIDRGSLSAPFNLICLDRQMPVLCGVEAARQIKSLQDAFFHTSRDNRGSRAPKPAYVVGMSASIDNPADWLRAGLDELLPKPFTSDDIDQLLLAVYSISFEPRSTVMTVPGAVTVSLEPLSAVLGSVTESRAI
jgi:CheY-like chemotaxis protein